MLLNILRQFYDAIASKQWIVPTPAVVLDYYQITSKLSGFFGLLAVLLAVATLHEGPLLLSGAHNIVDVTWPLLVYSTLCAFSFTALSAILWVSAWLMRRRRSKRLVQSLH